jgi:hypothetical protein
VIALSCLLVCGSVPGAEAWKVTTHMVLAERAARGVEDLDLRDTLLSNLAYLHAGSIGPDLHYALPLRNDSYSDLAHYCRTDALAGGMLRAAGADSRLRAFAYGWLSHNVGDSVAHPWVNGFVGDAFHGPLDFLKPVPGTSVNRNHGKLEAWVNARLLSDAPAGAQAEFLRAIKLYFDDTSLQDLIVKAYEAAYAGVRTCHGAPIYEPITRIKIQESALDMLRYVASSGGGLSDNLPTLPGNGLFLAGSTHGRYLDLTELYTRAAWAVPGRMLNLNLDQGIETARLGLQDRYAPVSEGDIFPTPGTAYVAGGDKPPYEDKCVQGAAEMGGPRRGGPPAVEPGSPRSPGPSPACGKPSTRRLKAPCECGDPNESLVR